VKVIQVVGLTGGIACGKSTLSRIFLSTQEDPPAVIDLDLIARQVVAAGTPAYHQIIHQFGSSLIDAETGEIDRKQLGSIIFGDPEKRRLLNDITHRPIFWSMLKQLVLHFLVRMYSQQKELLLAFLIELAWSCAERNRPGGP